MGGWRCLVGCGWLGWGGGGVWGVGEVWGGGGGGCTVHHAPRGISKGEGGAL